MNEQQQYTQEREFLMDRFSTELQNLMSNVVKYETTKEHQYVDEILQNRTNLLTLFKIALESEPKPKRGDENYVDLIEEILSN